ncbi:MAG: hypothetical protein INQ03_16485 [Candidatus Heimdallarchaeota archaeon]|nr:hypothetical protein [Candidatus Heimdallarchaeota archaeon]
MFELLMYLGLYGQIYLITGICLVIPLTISIKNFRLLKTADYALFIVLFAVGSILWISFSFIYSANSLGQARSILFLDDYPFILVGLSGLLYWSYLFLIAFHCKQVQNTEIMKLLPIILVYSYLILDELAFILFYSSIGSARIEPHPYSIYWRGPISTLYEFGIGIYLFYTYFTLHPVYLTRRTLFVKISWLLASCFRILLAFTFMVVNIINILDITFSPENISIYFGIRQLLQLGFTFFILGIALLFPEGLLITEYQLFRVSNLYKDVLSKKQTQKKQSMRIISYLRVLEEQNLLYSKT